MSLLGSLWKSLIRDEQMDSEEDRENSASDGSKENGHIYKPTKDDGGKLIFPGQDNTPAVEETPSLANELIDREASKESTDVTTTVVSDVETEKVAEPQFYQVAVNGVEDAQEAVDHVLAGEIVFLVFGEESEDLMRAQCFIAGAAQAGQWSLQPVNDEVTVMSAKEFDVTPYLSDDENGAESVN